MSQAHTVWVAGLDRPDARYGLWKRRVPLPTGIALNPHCELNHPLPAVPPQDYDDAPLLHVYRGKPSQVLEYLFRVFRKLVLVDAESGRVPAAKLQAWFIRWIEAYTTASNPSPEGVRDAIDLPQETDYAHHTYDEFYVGVQFAERTWVFHAAAHAGDLHE